MHLFSPRHNPNKFGFCGRLNEKVVMIVAACAMLSSCSTTLKTATSRSVSAPIVAASIADLTITGNKITYTYTPPKGVWIAGVDNCINAAVSEALQNAGQGADVLAEMQYTLVMKRGMGANAGKVKSVTVTGYPARYKNFRPADQKSINSALSTGIWIR